MKTEEFLTIDIQNLSRLTCKSECQFINLQQKVYLSSYQNISIHCPEHCPLSIQGIKETRLLIRCLFYEGGIRAKRDGFRAWKSLKNYSVL